MTFVFSPADKKMFKTAQRILGGHPAEALESRLGDGVSGDRGQELDSVARMQQKIDASFLRRAGLDELAWLRDCLDAGELPSATVLRSLRGSLLGPGPRGLDLEMRAGLHRLGRAVADLDVSSMLRITARLPRSWRRCVKEAWFRLLKSEECRASASSLRDSLASGGAS
jgi:hypothetical protein